MAIEFVVEDGTGKSDATSYVLVEYFEQYWENRGVDYTNDATYPVITKQAWLNVATEYIDYNYKFYGYSTEYATQSLQWPRTGLRDSKGNQIDDDSIPQELKDAVCRLAREAITQKDLETKVNTGEKSKKIGPVSITYKDGFKRDFNTATNLLRHLIKNFAALRTVS